jgi:hypothetical protein
MTQEILDFIDIRAVQCARFSLANLASEVRSGLKAVVVKCDPKTTNELKDVLVCAWDSIP